MTKIGCLKVPELKNWQNLDFSGFYVDFKQGCLQIDVFWTNPNLLGMAGPFQLFRPKNHLITCKTWYKSHKIPILSLKNPTQIGHMSFWERWKVISMLLLSHKWPIKLAGVHFMLRIFGQKFHALVVQLGTFLSINLLILGRAIVHTIYVFVNANGKSCF